VKKVLIVHIRFVWCLTKNKPGDNSISSGVLIHKKLYSYPLNSVYKRTLYKMMRFYGEGYFLNTVAALGYGESFCICMNFIFDACLLIYVVDKTTICSITY